MGMRNFWVTVDHAGHKPGGVSTGSHDITARFSLKRKGQSVAALRVEGFTTSDGTIELQVYSAAGVLVHTEAA